MFINVASVNSVIISFGDEISKDIASKVSKSYLQLKKLNDKAFIEIIPSYTTILIVYDVFIYDFKALKSLLETNIKLESSDNLEGKLINIDVYYGNEVGLDLELMSDKTSLSIEEIISIHQNKTYDVYAIGFLPGFAYLASVDDRIAMPRLDSPRKVIPKGSVSIADTQTAVYPQNSPGGWNIIGRTSFEFFDKSLESLSPVSVGDKIKFNSISREEFLNQGGVL